MAGNQTVVNIGPYLRARSAERQGVDLVEAWRERRAQLLAEAEQATREIEAAAEALAAAVGRFGALAEASRRTVQQAHDQVEMIDRAIANWTAVTAAGGGCMGDDIMDDGEG